MPTNRLGRTVHTGPKGGKYVIGPGGRKIYKFTLAKSPNRKSVVVKRTSVNDPNKHIKRGMDFAFEFDFEVILIDDSRPSVRVSTDEKYRAGFEWYKSFAEEQVEIEECKLVSFTLKRPNTISVKLSNVIDKHMIKEGIMNPDEDGNNPLKLKGKVYDVVATSDARPIRF